MAFMFAATWLPAKRKTERMDCAANRIRAEKQLLFCALFLCPRDSSFSPKAPVFFPKSFIQRRESP